MLAKRGCGGREGADERRGAVGAVPGGEAGGEEGGRGGVQGEEVWREEGRGGWGWGGRRRGVTELLADCCFNEGGVGCVGAGG